MPLSRRWYDGDGGQLAARTENGGTHCLLQSVNPASPPGAALTGSTGGLQQDTPALTLLQTSSFEKAKLRFLLITVQSVTALTERNSRSLDPTEHRVRAIRGSRGLETNAGVGRGDPSDSHGELKTKGSSRLGQQFKRRLGPISLHLVSELFSPSLLIHLANKYLYKQQPCAHFGIS